MPNKRNEPPKVRRVFTLHMTCELYAKLKYIADVDFRSMSNLIQLALTQYVNNYENAHGIIDVDPDELSD